MRAAWVSLLDVIRCLQEKIYHDEKFNPPSQYDPIARLMCDRIYHFLEEYRPQLTSQLSLLDIGQILEDLRSVMYS